MMLRPKYFGYSIILDVSYPYIHGSVEHIKKMNGIELEFRSSVLDLCQENKKISKVIFETCYLSDTEKRELCRIVRDVRPDYVKTSTGFGSGGATLEDVPFYYRRKKCEKSVIMSIIFECR